MNDISRRAVIGGVLAGATVAVLPGTASAVPPPGGTTIVPSDDTAPGWIPVRAVAPFSDEAAEEGHGEFIDLMRRIYYDRSWTNPDKYAVIQTPRIEVTHNPNMITLTGRYKVVEK